jgi:hypothetical protein
MDKRVVWDINPDGSAYTDNPTTLTSLVSYSGNTPEIISYTHNGATITDDLTLQFGGLAIRYIKNGAYSIEKYTATQFERVDYTGNFENQPLRFVMERPRLRLGLMVLKLMSW